MLGLVKSAALKGASAGIPVNAIQPGPVATRMMEAIDLARTASGGPSGQKGLGIPLQRYGTPDEVAAMVAFACSDEAGFSTDSSFHMDGGVLAGRG